MSSLDEEGPASREFSSVPDETVCRRRSDDADLEEAISGLWQRYPDMSAFGAPPRWLPSLAGVGVLVLLTGSAIDWRLALVATGLLFLFLFSGVTAMRLFAAVGLLQRGIGGKRVDSKVAPAATVPLPTYAVLVPLFEEVAVLASLVDHLRGLDYPAHNLDIVFILEERDEATRRAIAGLPLAKTMRTVVVPEALPRTKPKALNYALARVASDFVVVFDAEDRPEPDQLRKAVAAFQAAPRNVACFQAGLNVYNPNDGFFAGQFALEYSALFDGLLPALERLGGVIPLGGTSNHFRTSDLRAVGAWDPHNVTEDADLGIRLVRMGYASATLASTTWEEAPPRRSVWLGQRRRWLKGWILTWAVHMRRPARLAAELGPWRFALLQMVMVGVVLSALVYPVSLAIIPGLVAAGVVRLELPSGPAAALVWLGMSGLLAGFVAPMALAAIAVAGRRRWRLIRWVPLMPIYWGYVSIAAYQALGELGRRPFHWEKTRHGIGAAGKRSYKSRLARTAAAKVPSSR